MINVILRSNSISGKSSSCSIVFKLSNPKSKNYLNILIDPMICLLSAIPVLVFALKIRIRKCVFLYLLYSLFFLRCFLFNDMSLRNIFPLLHSFMKLYIICKFSVAQEKWFIIYCFKWGILHC